MKKGEVVEGFVEACKFPDRGSVRSEDAVFEVKGCIPGQKIKFSIKKIRNGRGEGRLMEVLEPSSLENAKPKCPHFGKCGGCSRQQLSYENQLELKRSQVKELIDAVCDYDYLHEGILSSPLEFGYRNKMEFSFGDMEKGGELCLGLHMKGSFYDIQNISACQIVNDDYNRILNAACRFFRRLGVSYFHKRSHTGYLRYLVIRRAATTGEILVNLVTTSMWSEEVQSGNVSSKDEGRMLADFADCLMSLDVSGGIVGIIHSVFDGVADTVSSDRSEMLYGKDYFFEDMLGLIFKITPFSFFQTNSLGAEVLYKRVRDYVGDTSDKVIFDLYSGTGTIAQILAPVARKVVGVEIVEEAVEAARENAMLNGLDNCEFIAGDVLRVIDDIEEKPDIIVLDPPREGVHPKALAKILAYNVKNIIYISCKPTSLVRDLEVFHEAGYKVERVTNVDLFPQTVHIETVALLSRVSK